MAVKNARINVQAQVAYPTLPQLDVGQIGSTLSVVNESAASDVYVSLDGINDDYHLVPGINAGGVFGGKYTKMWCRIGSASGSPVYVQLIAEN